MALKRYVMGNGAVVAYREPSCVLCPQPGVWYSPAHNGKLCRDHAPRCALCGAPAERMAERGRKSPTKDGLGQRYPACGGPKEACAARAAARKGG